MTQIEDDAFVLLAALDEFPSMTLAPSLDLQRKTGIPDERLYNAASHLASSGCCEMVQSVGSKYRYRLAVLPRAKFVYQQMKASRVSAPARPSHPDIHALVAKLHALQKQVEAVCASPELPRGDMFSRSAVDTHRSRLEKIVNALKVYWPDRFSGFRSEPSNPVDTERAQWAALQGDIAYCCELVADLASPVQKPAMSLTKEGLIVDGQHFDAMLLMSRIFESASKTIRIIDRYFSGKMLNILASRKPNVSASILTGIEKPDVRPLGEAFNKQHGGLSVWTLEPFLIHDRFIIIDDTDLYSLGTSMQEQMGGRLFMFSKVAEPGILQYMNSRWQDDMASAKQIV